MKYTFERKKESGTVFYKDIRIALDDPYHYLILSDDSTPKGALITANTKGGVVAESGMRVTFTSKWLWWNRNKASLSFVLDDGQEYAFLMVKPKGLFSSQRIYELGFKGQEDIYEFRRISNKKTGYPNAIEGYEIIYKNERVAQITLVSDNRVYSYFYRAKAKGYFESNSDFDVIEVGCFLQVMHFYDYMKYLDD